MLEKEINEAVVTSMERAEGERNRSNHAQAALVGVPEPELLERPRRRRFSAQYKLEIVRRVDACEPGEVGALLRAEGLRSSPPGAENIRCERSSLQATLSADPGTSR